ncbi:unnamed protein product [Zymoseptoria tritici ST99CH_3D7]|uniref:TATA-box-binding protein n=2 Tax=Zymoseptoria tritici TaxID=1047171 RepID=A0A1X7REC1_ZYMT9|nr:unnamed protein product [Zymoseptoria tritici ST99CH_3D7]
MASITRRSLASDRVPISMRPQVHNVVAGVNLNCRLDLKHIALSVRNASYRPKRFPAVVVRQREPRSTALIFRSGKMQIVGTKSVDDARLAGRKFARMLQKLGYQPRFEDFTVQNMVANVDTRMTIHLEGLMLTPGTHNYEPELFPGAAFRMVDPQVTFLVFHSGKVVLLKAKNEEDMHEAWDKFYPLLMQFRKE